MTPDMLGYIALGLVAGTASGFFGIGGGAIIVPALSIWFKVPYHVAVGTSLALIIPISLAGSTAHFRLGQVDARIFAACAVAGIIGAILGAMLLQRVPAVVAKRIFAVVLVFLAYRLWMK